MIVSAQELEKVSHQEKKDDKTATWLLQQAKDADLDMDDDLKEEVSKKLSGKKRLNAERDTYFDDVVDEHAKKGEAPARDRNREAQRKIALKASYQKEKEKELERKFANSSYLTPESIRYLNEVVKAKQTNVD